MATDESQIQTLEALRIMRLGQSQVPTAFIVSHLKMNPERHPHALEFVEFINPLPKARFLQLKQFGVPMLKEILGSQKHTPFELGIVG
jgi:hypothetical protein